MRMLSALPVGLRAGLAITFLTASSLGWTWGASQAGEGLLNPSVIAALVLLLLGSLLIVSLARVGTMLADLLGRWPAFDTELGLSGPLRDAVLRLNGQWRTEQDKQAALEQRIAELQAELEDVRRADGAMLNEMADLCSAIGNGVLDRRVSGEEGSDEQVLPDRFNQMAETLDAVMGDLKALFARMAEGDLSESLRSGYGGDFAVIRDGAEQAIERLGTVIGTIVQAANTISGATVQLNKEAKGLAESAAAQSDSLDRTAADAASLSEAARANEAAAKRANQRADEARAAAENGVQVVNRSIDAMNQMAEMSQRISEITSLINEIAFQTNLLALNASVEAARAG